MNPLPSSDFGLEFQLHRSGHVNPVIGFLPVDYQRATIENEVGAAVGELCPGGAHERRTRSGATRLGQACPPLPDTKANVLPVNDLRKP